MEFSPQNAFTFIWMPLFNLNATSHICMNEWVYSVVCRWSSVVGRRSSSYSIFIHYNEWMMCVMCNLQLSHTLSIFTIVNWNESPACHITVSAKLKRILVQIFCVSGVDADKMQRTTYSLNHLFLMMAFVSVCWCKHLHIIEIAAVKFWFLSLQTRTFLYRDFLSLTGKNIDFVVLGDIFNVLLMYSVRIFDPNIEMKWLWL